MIRVPELGLVTVRTIEQAIAENTKPHHVFSGWCAETRWVYLVEVEDREPVAWKFVGPMERSAAREFLTATFVRLQ